MLTQSGGYTVIKPGGSSVLFSSVKSRHKFLGAVLLDVPQQGPGDEHGVPSYYRPTLTLAVNCPIPLSLFFAGSAVGGFASCARGNTLKVSGRVASVSLSA
jgi:hypothetical protein